MSTPEHIILTSHPRSGGKPVSPINWGAAAPDTRGPIIGTVADSTARNTIGTHSGS